MPTISERFLATVWRHQPSNRGFVFTSLKDREGRWSDIAQRRSLATQGAIVLPEEPGDIYFAPCMFAAKRRRNDQALPGAWLYADLDEVDPSTLTILPTAAWESSPGRWQALWMLSRPLPPDKLQRLNQLLTYATGADKGGWHASKVLRVPGTRNYKYRGRPSVKLLWFHKNAIDPRTIVAYVKEMAEVRALDTSPRPGIDVYEATAAPGKQHPSLPNTTAAHLRRRYKKKLGRRARKLLTTRTVLASEDRSARLWELHNLCLAAGCSPEETLILVRSSAYNKYSGQRREERMLWTEIQKAVRARRRLSDPRAATPTTRQADKPSRSPGSRRPDTEPEDEPTTTAHDADSETPHYPTPTRLARYLGKNVRPPAWLVESIWGRAAHGVWAGDYKTYKSTLLMDLAVSVASGRPFLNSFPVHRTGPVYYIQEENSHAFMHDRLHRIVQSKGLGNIVIPNGRRTSPLMEFGHDLDFHLSNLSGFDLTNSAHLMGLDLWAKDHRPALIILDPLYRLAPGADENSAVEMSPLLSALADISAQNDCALILAHHYNKPSTEKQGQRAGHRISGTGVFGRWFESSVYAERAGDPEQYAIKFHNEHREHGSDAPQIVTVEMEPDSPDTYAIHLADTIKEDASSTPSDSSDALDLDKRKTRIKVTTVRTSLGLDSSRAAQVLLKDKGYEVRKVSNRLWGYPPKR